MSVMFIDLAGFTGMSERLGDRIIPLLSRYFDSVSVQIQNQNGTIDKFIGDAVMAFWGAPAPTRPAVDCCRAALACRRAVEEAGAGQRPWRARQDSHRHQFRRHAGRHRIGEVRLNYTVIGDAVNIEPAGSTNKAYGSTIIIGPKRRLAGKASWFANSTGWRSMAAQADCRSMNA